MKPAVNKISLGIILSCVSLTVSGIPIINDFIGISIIIFGLRELDDDYGYFLKAQKACEVIILLTAAGYILTVYNKANSNEVIGIINNAVLPCIGVIISTVFYFYLISGLKTKLPDKKETMDSYEKWKMNFFVLMAALVFYFAFSINIIGTNINKICMAVLFITEIIFKVSFALKIKKDAGTVEIEEISNE